MRYITTEVRALSLMRLIKVENTNISDFSLILITEKIFNLSFFINM